MWAMAECRRSGLRKPRDERNSLAVPATVVLARRLQIGEDDDVGLRRGSAAVRGAMRRLSSGWLLLGLGAFAISGCGGSAEDASAGGRGSNPSPTGGAGGTGTGGGIDPGAGGNRSDASTPPPETEVEKAFEAPVATERFVWAT